MSDFEKRIEDINGLRLAADEAHKKYLTERERLVNDFLESNNLDKLCKRKSDEKVGKLVTITKSGTISDLLKFYPIKKDGELSKNSSGFILAWDIKGLFEAILKDFEPVPVTE